MKKIISKLLVSFFVIIIVCVSGCTTQSASRSIYAESADAYAKTISAAVSDANKNLENKLEMDRLDLALRYIKADASQSTSAFFTAGRETLFIHIDQEFSAAPAQDSDIEDVLIERAIYGTGWEGTVVIQADTLGNYEVLAD